MVRDDFIAKFPLKPWHPLTELPEATNTSSKVAAITSTTGEAKEKTPLTGAILNLTPNARKILLDCLAFLFAATKIRIKRLGLSGRNYEQGKHELVEKGFVIESSAGMSKYLIPTSKAYEALGDECPYPNKEFVEHSFYQLLFKFLYSKHPAIKSVHLEYNIGRHGHCVDIVTIGHNGNSQAIEIILSSGNINQALERLRDTSFSRIVFLCRNHDLSTTVTSVIKQANLPSQFFSRIECQIFSAVLTESRKYFKM